MLKLITVILSLIIISCGSSEEDTPALASFSIGGSVSGLAGSLSIQNNNTHTLTISNNGIYTFNGKFSAGSNYKITVSRQPAGQHCAISNANGQISRANIANINIHCRIAFTVSGSYSTAPLIQVDSDINDPFAVANISNNTVASAQVIANFSSVQGFLSLEPTARFTEQDRFASSTDEFDVFKVTLQKNQTLRLQVVDFAAGGDFQGDLDLELYEGANLVAFSDSITEFETLTVPADGDYFILVRAFEGTSKYTLSLDGVSTVTTPAQTSSMNFIPGEAIVQFTPGTALSQSRASNQLMRLSHSESSRATLAKFDLSNNTTRAATRTTSAPNFFQQLAIDNPESYQKHKTLQHIKQLRQRAEVKYAEPNYIRQAYKVPNDTHYHLQWHYRAIKLPQAWNITTGDRAANVIVAVVDTGVFLTHTDLSNQLVAGYDFIANPTNAGDGDGIDNNPDDPGDGAQINSSSWHGTHVAGTVAAQSNNNNGVAGVSWGAKIMPLRVLGKQGGSSYDIMQAVLYAAGLPNDSGTLPAQKADIINLSLGGSGFTQQEQDVYTAARDAGVIIVAAAGNENTSQRSYPASYAGVISVSATDFNNHRAPYSNFGSRIDIAAPGGHSGADVNNDGHGDGVLSASVDDSSGSREPTFTFHNGTSMAAPHVAGVFALMRAVHADISPADIDRLLPAITTDLGTPGRDDIYGHGLIDALKAVQQAQILLHGEDLPPQPALITAEPNQLTLGAITNGAMLTLTNQGDIADSITSVSNNANWLTVTANNVDADGLGTYQLTIDRTGLADASYLGIISFNLSTGNVLKVSVSMLVGSFNTTGNAGTNYILLIDQNNNIIDQAIPVDQGNGIFNYRFNYVPVGFYQIVGGSDIDNDQLICQLAETCGGFPTVSALSTFEVRNTDITGLDFVMNILANFGSSLSSDNKAKQPASLQRLPTKKQAATGVQE